MARKRRAVTAAEVASSPGARTVNMNKGSSRYGKSYSTQKAKGGVWHVYGAGADKDRVFVSNQGAKRSRGRTKNASLVKELTERQAMMKRGGKPKARVPRAPKPGDRGGRTLPTIPPATPAQR